MNSITPAHQHASTPMHKLRDNELMIAGKTLENNILAYTYFTINFEGVLYPAQDNRFSITETSASLHKHLLY